MIASKLTIAHSGTALAVSSGSAVMIYDAQGVAMSRVVQEGLLWWMNANAGAIGAAAAISGVVITLVFQILNYRDKKNGYKGKR